MDAIENKAKELVDKFIRYTPAEKEYEYDYAKRCAVISCQEILELPMAYHINYDEDYSIGVFYGAVIEKIKTL